MPEDILFASAEPTAAPVDDAVDSQNYLIFIADDLRLGVVADYVEEILTSQPITYLPRVPEFIRGIINMRGQIIPILDVRLRLGKEPKEDSLVVVLNLNGTYLGILVDAVYQMVDIRRSSILPMPAHSTQMLVAGMCSLPDGSGTMMVLDCDQLMPND